jgi:hypothetical protein
MNPSLASSPSSNRSDVYIREFLPRSSRDPIFSILRNLFIRVFDNYYKHIEANLKLEAGKSLIQWLDETFDNEQEAILTKNSRCFILCTNENEDSKESIRGFLTLREEEEGSVYIAQFVIRGDMKRKGYGCQLLQNVRQMYPPNTLFWVLCRRADQPALQFYINQGAKFMKDFDIAKKYGYDPELYIGLEFVATDL